MAVQIETLARIKKWIKDYRSNKAITFNNTNPQRPYAIVHETNSVTIDLKKIKDFIAYIDDQNRNNPNGILPDQDNQINAIRFYIVRQNDILDSEGNGRTEIFKDLAGISQTQLSLLALPVVRYRWDPAINYDRFGRPVLPTPRIYQAVKGRDYLPDATKIRCLYAASPISEHTGLCPYNCDETLDGD